MHGNIPLKPDEPLAAGWYCIRTTMPGIFDAWGDLAQRGFDVYLLLGRFLTARRTYSKPLLGPYIFVWSTPFGIGRAYAARHVCRQFCLENFPHPIPESEIARLWAREADGLFIFDERPITETERKKQKQILRSLRDLAILKPQAHYVGS